MTNTLKAAAPKKKTPKRPSAQQFTFGYLVHDVSRIRRTVMDLLMWPYGITRSQWSVLSTLSRAGNDGMMQVDLARLMEVGKVTVGGLIDRLEASGHVERRADANDRRAKRVFITEKGFDVIGLMIELAATMNRRILVLDTASDGAARLYARAGWKVVGVVPEYALLPGGEPCATTYFYKDLSSTSS